MPEDDDLVKRQAAALVHRTRAAIVRTLLDNGEQSAERIWAALPDLAFPDVVYHLRVLEDAELVARDGDTWRLDTDA